MDDRSELPLGREIAAYLRSRRLAANLPQTTLAEEGRRIGIHFDNSWVSQWERLGPKPGFVKALAYLRLVDADLSLISEMVHAPVAWPREVPTSLDETLGRCRELALRGELDRALGLAVAALRGIDADDASGAARLLLASAIIAKRAEMLALAGHYAERAREAARAGPVDDLLSAKIAIESSTIATSVGSYDDAVSYLERIPPRLLEQHRTLRAQVLHARAYLLGECRDIRSALELCERALTLYAGEPGSEAAPALLSVIGMHRAALGQPEAADRAIKEALRLASDSGSPLIDLQVRFRAGRAYTLSGKYAAALDALLEAERLAERTRKPIRLFEIRLALLELGDRSRNRPLSTLLRNRLRRDREQLALPRRVIRDYEELVGA